MRVLDASSIIYGWDNYPPIQFPKLWVWMAGRIEAGELAIPRAAMDEVVHRAPDCGKWLKVHDIPVLEMTDQILRDALRIKGLLGIQGEKYHPDGVGENDLIIIATARAHSVELMTDEARQRSLPIDRRKFKIPAVCALTEVDVVSLNFLDYIKKSQTVFG